MQSEHRHGGVRVRVPPRVVHGGVVHGENLHDVHPRRGGDVHERSEVAEIPGAEGLARSERKDGNGNAAPAPLARESEMTVARDEPRGRGRAVGTPRCGRGRDRRGVSTRRRTRGGTRGGFLHLREAHVRRVDGGEKITVGGRRASHAHSRVPGTSSPSPSPIAVPVRVRVRVRARALGS